MQSLFLYAKYHSNSCLSALSSLYLLKVVRCGMWTNCYQKYSQNWVSLFNSVALTIAACSKRWLKFEWGNITDYYSWYCMHDVQVSIRSADIICSLKAWTRSHTKPSWRYIFMSSSTSLSSSFSFISLLNKLYLYYFSPIVIAQIGFLRSFSLIIIHCLWCSFMICWSGQSHLAL